ncbi:hypothetical protein [Actinopolymorpha pittospori]|uniref:Uncharacterized protein n=1 Tax=Actinopolymorpha pittospori TaxID=648752 RepID=A0A927RKE0_9ACTN|nr:hypothetical protein [Actinopolymorpha pittospori]MBE1608161.1 hypothetical protein [Actinopolymorpha pittospori]
MPGRAGSPTSPTTGSSRRGGTARGRVPGLIGTDTASAQVEDLQGVNARGTAIYQVDVTAEGLYIADGDGPEEVNGYFQVRTPDWGRAQPLRQFDGNVDLLASSRKG